MSCKLKLRLKKLSKESALLVNKKVDGKSEIMELLHILISLDGDIENGFVKLFPGDGEEAEYYNFSEYIFIFGKY